MWEIAKPFLQDYYVPFSVYDPTFHKRAITKDPAPLDPCCTSCRQPDGMITVCVYVDDESYQPALDFVLANSAVVEAALVRKLGAVQNRTLVQHYEENLPGMPQWEKHWKFIQAEIGGDEVPRLDRMFKLTGLSIRRADPEGMWLVGYEFQSAWDMDHGLEIVLWEDKVLTASGMMETTSVESPPIPGIKVDQEYTFDPGDYRLP